MFFCPSCNFKTDITKNIESIIHKDNIASNETNKDEKNNDAINKAFFYCANCGNYEEMQPRTMIFMKTSEKNTFSIKNNDIIYDNTLPHTRKYVCPNEKCATHNNKHLKDAIFYKNNGKIIYVCIVCKSDWAT